MSLGKYVEILRSIDIVLLDSQQLQHAQHYSLLLFSTGLMRNSSLVPGQGCMESSEEYLKLMNNPTRFRCLHH
ncbi:hypothetical protein RO3G_14435 [Rhizopus delemar RA 99-880]|uniref:Uncharacterized protein n=1 Tax=Rhizopus delemar (strain RA 99-880 / ATCC MYA-4621 / FGSC 9543 / NRRL 43880) TaxID=246409 RepID=I1CMP4_RHIO9|nr:hypothetical protein RO3G_14435 [Rhizopus delemar RA 99-880]|eukprot:EIE89724.1 hypothetical protein RO3G_14435 [Rhizopus delemar RA 99-880]